MITLLVICVLVLTVKLACAAIGAAWGIFKVIMTIVLLPLMLIGAIISGLVHLAIPIVLIALVVSFIWPRIKAHIA